MPQHFMDPEGHKKQWAELLQAYHKHKQHANKYEQQKLGQPYSSFTIH